MLQLRNNVDHQMVCLNSHDSPCDIRGPVLLRSEKQQPQDDMIVGILSITGNCTEGHTERIYTRVDAVID